MYGYVRRVVKSGHCSITAKLSAMREFKHTDLERLGWYMRKEIFF